MLSIQFVVHYEPEKAFSRLVDELERQSKPMLTLINTENYDRVILKFDPEWYRSANRQLSKVLRPAIAELFCEWVREVRSHMQPGARVDFFIEGSGEDNLLDQEEYFKLRRVYYVNANS